jgi:hypothetical protein
LRLNSPVNKAINEAHRIDDKSKLGCFVNIGTSIIYPEPLGKEKVKLQGIAKTCANISLNCDIVVQDFAKSPSGRKLWNTHWYFRFDVTRKLNTVELEDYEALDDIDAFVDAYLESQAVAMEIKLCAKSLS